MYPYSLNRFVRDLFVLDLDLLIFVFAEERCSLMFCLLISRILIEFTFFLGNFAYYNFDYDYIYCFGISDRFYLVVVMSSESTSHFSK